MNVFYYINYLRLQNITFTIPISCRNLYVCPRNFFFFWIFLSYFKVTNWRGKMSTVWLSLELWKVNYFECPTLWLKKLLILKKYNSKKGITSQKRIHEIKSCTKSSVFELNLVLLVKNNFKFNPSTYKSL